MWSSLCVSRKPPESLFSGLKLASQRLDVGQRGVVCGAAFQASLPDHLLLLQHLHSQQGYLLGCHHEFSLGHAAHVKCERRKGKVYNTQNATWGVKLLAQPSHVSGCLRQNLVGWKPYFRLAETPGAFADIDGWVRHRSKSPIPT